MGGSGGRGGGGEWILYPGSGFAFEGQERRFLLGAQSGKFPVERGRKVGRGGVRVGKIRNTVIRAEKRSETVLFEYVRDIVQVQKTGYGGISYRQSFSHLSTLCDSRVEARGKEAQREH